MARSSRAPRRPRAARLRLLGLLCDPHGHAAPWCKALDTHPGVTQYPRRDPGWHAGLPCTQDRSDRRGSPQSLLVGLPMFRGVNVLE